MNLKKAIQYIRISQKDQSNFSIEGQIETNHRYAERHGIEIVRTYIDDGESAKNFDRPNWQLLMADLKANKKEIKYLIVMKYDRLIRNAAQGLMALERIEQKLNIKVLSAQEHLSIDPHSPFFFKMRADMLVNAEFERLVISDRTKFGVWRAKCEGRFLGTAPFGYKNARDDRNKPILVVDPDRAKIIQKIFELYLAGVGYSEIYRTVRKMGFTLTGNEIIKRVLTNPIYSGFIEVPDYKDEPGRMIEGIHEPLISKVEFMMVKEMITPSRRTYSIFNDEVPLRGLVKCPKCHKKLTAAPSKGRKKYYWYYFCHTCKHENINADKAHDNIKNIMASLSLSKDSIDYIIGAAKRKLGELMKDQMKLSNSYRTQIADLRKKVVVLEEKYLSDKINDETYNRWFEIYMKNLGEFEQKLRISETRHDTVISAIEKYVPYLTNLEFIYLKASTVEKQLLLKEIFSEDIELTKEGVRTGFTLEMFRDKALHVKGLTMTCNAKTGTKITESPISSPDGILFEHVNLRFINLIAKIA